LNLPGGACIAFIFIIFAFPLVGRRSCIALGFFRQSKTSAAESFQVSEPFVSRGFSTTATGAGFLDN
jgi:hypothetical protein